MPDPKIVVQILPGGIQLTTLPGRFLLDILREGGISVPSPCGGRGRCGKCDLIVRGKLSAPTPEEKAMLESRHRFGGYRLACRVKVLGDCTVEIGPSNLYLEDQAYAGERPHAGQNSRVKIAVDVGTTTMTAALLTSDQKQLRSVIRKNPQVAYGSDVVSRIAFANRPDGLSTLQMVVVKAVDEMISDLLAVEGIPKTLVETIGLVGNTCMHHLFLGISTKTLGQMPFEPAALSTPSQSAASLGLTQVPPDTSVKFLPNIAGFVGSDTLAASIRCGLHIPQPEEAGARMLVDAGTNGEIALAYGDRILCCSTAAGPAFEGMNITHGMLATAGAIDQFWIDPSRHLQYTVIGHIPPTGLCGSALIQLIALMADDSAILPNGRFYSSGSPQVFRDGWQGSGRERRWVIPTPEAEDHPGPDHPLYLTQEDVRQVQLAKGAIRAGIDTLLGQMRLDSSDLSAVYLAGHFGNHLDIEAAQRIGLIPPIDLNKVHAVGHAACEGLSMILNDKNGLQMAETFSHQFTHIPLHQDPGFMDRFAHAMRLEKEAE